MYTYKQKSGVLLKLDGSFAGFGYAGRGAGKNNPDMQNVKGIGPIPCGVYTAQPPTDDDVVGRYAMRLIPDPSNEMFGRNSFFMHGDSASHPGEASHGCIVMPRNVREAFWISDNHQIEVIHG